VPKKDVIDLEKETQRKYAEQLGKRVNSSADDIEKGVEDFLKKSSESLGGNKMKPPYRRPVWYTRFFSLIKQKTINKFTLEFLTLNITQVKSEAYKLRNGLRFLGLIDNKRNPTSKLNDLRVSGDQFNKNLRIIIEEAYFDLLSTVMVDTSKPESLVNFMINRYGYSESLAEQAVVLFVFFAKKAEIPLSKEVMNFKAKKARRETRKSKTKTKKPNVEQEDDDSFARLDFDEFHFRVKKDIASIEFARKQINSLIDYLIKKLERKSDD